MRRLADGIYALVRLLKLTRRRLTLSSERAARSPTPVNPAGFEPRIPRVPNSGPVVPCVSFPRLTCELTIDVLIR